MKAYIVEILLEGSEIHSVLRFLCLLNPHNVYGIIGNIRGQPNDPMSREIF